MPKVSFLMPLLPAPQQVIAIESAKLEGETATTSEFSIIPTSVVSGVKFVLQEIGNLLKPRKVLEEGEEEEEEEDYDSQYDDRDVEPEEGEDDSVEDETSEPDYDDE